ncbi:hypothetical protein BGZ63DRAFT_42509 [Mariannaea sp. PMI_226]|nr:hypothetical protein BGZ63DRAFT_42509 [Mariannaea sp. PMI_226]
MKLYSCLKDLSSRPPESNSPFGRTGNGIRMIGIGYSLRFTHKALGDGYRGLRAETTYEPEPLEPLFGLDEHPEPLPAAGPEPKPQVEIVQSTPSRFISWLCPRDHTVLKPWAQTFSGEIAQPQKTQFENASRKDTQWAVTGDQEGEQAPTQAYFEMTWNEIYHVEPNYEWPPQ